MFAAAAALLLVVQWLYAEGSTPDDTLLVSGVNYSLFRRPRMYKEAIAICEENGLLLAPIFNKDQNDALVSAFQELVGNIDPVKNPTTRAFWIGYNDLNRNGVYTWIGGFDSTFDNYAPGVRKDDPATEVLLVDYQFTTGAFVPEGEWHDTITGWTRPFACAPADSGSVQTEAPSPQPTTLPTPIPTPIPSTLPTPLPTTLPTPVPTPIPVQTPIPTPNPTPIPTLKPSTPIPSPSRTAIPTLLPTPLPGPAPTSTPTAKPMPVGTISPGTEATADPSRAPVSTPASPPTSSPETPTSSPGASTPTGSPVNTPSFAPVVSGTSAPTGGAETPTRTPTAGTATTSAPTLASQASSCQFQDTIESELCSEGMSSGCLQTCGRLATDDGRYKLVVQEEGIIVGYDTRNTFTVAEAQYYSSNFPSGEPEQYPYVLAVQANGYVGIYVNDSLTRAVWTPPGYNPIGVSSGPYCVKLTTTGDIQVLDSMERVLWDHQNAPDSSTLSPSLAPTTSSPLTANETAAPTVAPPPAIVIKNREQDYCLTVDESTGNVVTAACDDEILEAQQFRTEVRDS